MEFFRIVKVHISEDNIKESLLLSDLEKFSNHIFPIGEITERTLETGGNWGEFTLCRDEIKGGLRFYLQECPNALAWTVTTGHPPERESMVLHLTINRRRKQQQFIDEINEFLDDHAECLMDYLT